MRTNFKFISMSSYGDLYYHDHKKIKNDDINEMVGKIVEVKLPDGFLIIGKLVKKVERITYIEYDVFYLEFDFHGKEIEINLVDENIEIVRFIEE